MGSGCPACARLEGRGGMLKGPWSKAKATAAADRTDEAIDETA